MKPSIRRSKAVFGKRTLYLDALRLYFAQVQLFGISSPKTLIQIRTMET